MRRLLPLVVASVLFTACRAAGPAVRSFTYPPGWQVKLSSAVSPETPSPTKDDTKPLPSNFPCGDAFSLVAIGRVPPVRVVVYDPVSNSFAYVNPCPEKDDLMVRDRYHLVLTTQKIRLLLMPYSAPDGDLLLEVKAGTGAEFDLIPKEAVPAVGQPAAKPEDIGKPPAVEAAASPALAEAKSTAETAGASEVIGAANAGRLSPQWSLSFRQEDKTNAAGHLLLNLEAMIAAYRQQADKARMEFGKIARDAQCLERFRMNVRADVGRAFTNDSEFTLANDIPFQAVLDEARRRRDALLLQQGAPPGCIKDSSTFAMTITRIDSAFGDTKNLVATSETILDRADAVFANLKAETTPPRINDRKYAPETWKAQKENYAEGLKTLREHQAKVEKLGDDTLDFVKTVNGNFQADLDSFNSAASQIQRFDYPPLHEGESVSFTIRHIGVDDKTTRLPGRANMIELRSTPADLFRFGMGLAKTEIKDPEFRTVVTETGAGPKKVLEYADAGNGNVIAGAFVHHNWTRRSPFLTPTLFERFTPTISVGLPLTDNKAIFDQLLMGLNWELTPGFDFVIGQHFKKVNTLIKGHHIGEETTLDSSDLEQKKFRNAWFFGIVMNTDLFNTIGSRRSAAK